MRAMKIKCLIITGLVIPLLGCIAPQPYEANPVYLGMPGSGGMDIDLVYFVTGPLSYQTMALRDVMKKEGKIVKDVRGRACQTGISIPFTQGSVAWGPGGFARALEAAQRAYLVDALYDVRVDEERLVVAGLYQKLCLRVSGVGFRFAKGRFSGD